MSDNRELRAYRRHKKRQKTARLMTIESYTFIGTIWFNWEFDEHGEWRRVGTYPKRKKHSHVQRFYKKYSNRLIRRSGKAYQNGDYRKAFDYWYTIW